jgi:hypothetical protein
MGSIVVVGASALQAVTNRPARTKKKIVMVKE